MNDEITYATYHAEALNLAKSCRAEARERGCDLSEVIHEVVNRHSWIIYTRHNLSVLQYTDHEDAAEEMGGLDGVLRSSGVSGLLTYLACAAMIRDVKEAASDVEEEEDEGDADEI